MVGKQRNFGLDIIRAISILFVLIAHRFALPVEMGVLGVQIFFVLSGFLIGQILLRDFKEHGSVPTVIKFWKRRWFRTLPMYYLVLIFKIVIYGNPFGWKMIVYFLFLQANILGISFFNVSWSLVVEEWFYLFLPIAIFLFFRKGIEPYRFSLFLLFFILLFFATRFCWNYFHKGVIVFQFDCLLLGVVLAHLKINHKKIFRKMNSLPLVVFGIISVFFLVIALGNMRNVELYDTFYKVVWYFLISLSIAVIIPFVEQSAFLNNRLRNVKPLYYFFTWTSVLTYSFYLIHAEIYAIPLGNLPLGLNLTIQITLLYVICFLAYAFFEHPMLSLRDNFSLKQYVKVIRNFSNAL
jgi:peptidoglycan/LPS O-acetylase OafA/YrhL